MGPVDFYKDDVSEVVRPSAVPSGAALVASAGTLFMVHCRITVKKVNSQHYVSWAHKSHNVVTSSALITDQLKYGYWLSCFMQLSATGFDPVRVFSSHVIVGCCLSSAAVSAAHISVCAVDAVVR